MFPAPYFEILSTLTEIALCLSPAVIKTVNTTVETGVLIKVLVYILIAFLLAPPKDYKSIFELSFSNLLHYIVLGSISFITISLTYFGFKELPLSTSMSINYSFPIILVLISQFFLGYDQPLYFLPIFIGAYITMLYILRPTQQHIEKFNNMDKDKKTLKYKAIAALILGSAVSCVRFVLRKTGLDSHETSMIRSNIGALIISIAFFFSNNKLPDLRPEIWIKLLLFNIFIGYIVSKFRSLAFNSVPEIYYGIFIFIGTAIAYGISEHLPNLRQIEADDFKTP